MIRLLILIPALLFSSKSTEQWMGDVGTVVQYALPVTAIGMTAYRLDKEGIGQFFCVFLATEATKETLKRSIRSTRPNGGKNSFPSGHTSCSFASSAFIQQRYGWKYGIPAYLAAAFVGYSRVYVKAHRVRDVVAGAALGILFNMLITTPFDLCVTPTRDGGVISLSRNF